MVGMVYDRMKQKAIKLRIVHIQKDVQAKKHCGCGVYNLDSNN